MSKQFFPVCRACRFKKFKMGDELTISTKESKCAICGEELKGGFTLLAEAEEQKFGMGETYWKFVKVIDWLDSRDR